MQTEVHAEGFIQTSTENTAVNNTRVLLGTPPGLPSQVLTDALQNQCDVDIVGPISDPIATLVAITRTKPDIWIHSWEEGPELQSMLTHVYSCDPTIAVVRIDLNEPNGYAQVPLNSLASLVSFIKQGRPLESVC